MKLYHLSSGLLKVNTYFLVNEETSNAICIDGGENYKTIKETQDKFGFKIKALLLTHAHFDHSGNAKMIQDDGAKVYASRQEADKLRSGKTLASSFGRNYQNVVVDYILEDGQEIEIEGINVKVIATPGHTDGSLTFMVDNMLFTGDTLFLESIGRTDFPTGEREVLINSVKKLFGLSGDYVVYPGHQEFTTLSHERKYNNFVDYD